MQNKPQKINYQRVLEKTLAGLQGRPRLLLHACCAPCSSYVLEYLCRYFDITLYYYNPNISPREEYDTRARELERLARELPEAARENVQVLIGPYDNEKFEQLAQGLEDLPEGGARCMRCYRLRLEQTALLANEMGFDYFTTSLSISPHKNAQALCAIGQELAEKCGSARYLCADFKKNGGYLRSCELSRIHSLYRQNYCGCRFSKRQAESCANKEKESLE